MLLIPGTIRFSYPYLYHLGAGYTILVNAPDGLVHIDIDWL